MACSSVHPSSGLWFLQSSLITVCHGMFNRHNGVSTGLFSSLNISYGVGDSYEHVGANREIIKKGIGISALVSARQVHGSRVACVADAASDKELDGYDALITDQQEIGLMIQQADCQAILLHDPKVQVIAAIHCGWRGSAANIIQRTIEKMQNEYRVTPIDLRAVISPSLGPCCAEFINYKKELPSSLHSFMGKPNHFNFWDISIHQLEECGICPENIDAARICSACDANYFSYRRSRKKGLDATGRNCSVIGMVAS